MSQPYKIEGSRVYGNGMSFNCTNIVTAEQLLNTLNNYENTLKLNKNIKQQFDNIQKQIIQVKLSINILQDDVTKLKQTMEVE